MYLLHWLHCVFRENSTKFPQNEFLPQIAVLEKMIFSFKNHDYGFFDYNKKIRFYSSLPTIKKLNQKTNLTWKI